MKALRVVLDVVRDLVVGDDWRMVVGIAAMVLIIVGGRAVGVPVW